MVGANLFNENDSNSFKEVLPELPVIDIIFALEIFLTTLDALVKTSKESFILTLDDTSSIVLNIKVPEIYLNILKPGLSAEVKSDSFKRRFYGTVNSVSSRVDPSTRSVLANIVVENKELKLIPGMLLDIKIIYDKKEQLGIPENSILIQGDTAFVYKVLEDNTVEKVEVKIGKRNFGKVSIIDGLYLGDKIVAEGISKVRDKIKIKILN